MAEKAHRLKFTEDELSDRDIRKAAKKAKKAADKADRAYEKLPTKRRVRITRTDGVSEAVDENLSEKLRGERQSPKADREKETPTRKRQSRARKDGAAETTSSRLSDKLTSERQSAKAVKGKLRVEVTETTAKKPGIAGRAAVNAPAAALATARNTVRDAVGDTDHDNSGADALQTGESAARTAGNVANNGHYSHKLKQYDKAEKLGRKSDEANVEALFKKELHDNPEGASNPISKWRQKQELKKRYAEARAAGKSGASASGATKGGKKAAEETKSVVDKAVEFVKEHPKIVIGILIIGLLVALIAGVFTSCASMFAGSGNAVLGTSYTAEDADITGTDGDYSALESALQNQINNIESTHSGYDEYRYDLAEIGHNPYELASYLTVMFEDYTREEVQSTLQSLFAQQYTLTLTPEVEIRYREETSTDPDTGATTTTLVPYNYYILNVTLTNKGLGAVVLTSGLTDDQRERYDILMETYGNRKDLFGDVSFAVSGGEYTDYDIPGEALTDERFRRMITEAEKYLGYPYVWGGSSPSTSFDCSGFVSWVINNCGNGWSVGRLGAVGLKNICAIIPPSEAKPGDLIFFHHTYNAPDPSNATHVGIYVGNGMMIHCGNPISYTSIESSYWQEHFLCFGRLSS